MRKESTEPLYGIISAITFQKKDKHRASIFIEGEFAFGVNVSTIEHFRLRKGDEVDSISYAKLREYDDGISARRIAQKYLNSRRRTERDVRRKLHDEGISEELIEKTIEELKQSKLIDDAAYAHAFIHDRLLTKPVSNGKLVMELQAKGIKRSIAEEAIRTVSNEDDEVERAASAARKKLAVLGKRIEDKRIVSQKLYAFLAGRGFTGAIIRKTLERLGHHAEEVDV